MGRKAHDHLASPILTAYPCAMSDWMIYLFFAFLFVSYLLLARVCYVQGRDAHWFGEKVPEILMFSVLVTCASLAVDVAQHGFGHLSENPRMVSARFLIVIGLQIVPYLFGVFRGRGKRDNGIIGMD